MTALRWDRPLLYPPEIAIMQKGQQDKVIPFDFPMAWIQKRQQAIAIHRPLHDFGTQRTAIIATRHEWDSFYPPRNFGINLHRTNCQRTNAHITSLTHLWYHRWTKHSMRVIIHQSYLTLPFSCIHLPILTPLFSRLPTLAQLYLSLITCRARDTQIPTHMTQTTTSMPLFSPPSYL